MVSWGPPKDGGEKFYKGMKHEKPWVQDLNWSNRCKLESKKFMKKKIMQHTLASNMGSSIPPYGIGIDEKTSDKAAQQYVNERGSNFGPSSSRKGTARQKKTGRSTARSTARSTVRSSARSGRSSYRGSTGRSSIATIDTEMADLIRETAESELKQLREALQRETQLRTESDKKIELLLNELQSMKK
jgi:hypothetical protein